MATLVRPRPPSIPPRACVALAALIAQRPVAKRGSVQPLLERLFEAERRVRQLHREAGRSDSTTLVTSARRAIAAARGLDGEAAEAQLVCVARLLGDQSSSAAADGLIEVLASPVVGARVEAGEQLLGLAEDDFPRLAAAIGRALESMPSGSPALVELAYLLAETQHDGAAELLATMLEHPDGDVVGAAIDALVAIGDPAVIDWVAPLEQDPRRCEVLGDGEESLEATVGDLARQARELLSGLGSPETPREPSS